MAPLTVERLVALEGAARPGTSAPWRAPCGSEMFVELSSRVASWFDRWL